MFQLLLIALNRRNTAVSPTPSCLDIREIKFLTSRARFNIFLAHFLDLMREKSLHLLKYPMIFNLELVLVDQLLVCGRGDHVVVIFLELSGDVEKVPDGVLVLRLVLMTNELSQFVEDGAELSVHVVRTVQASFSS